jgi:hypothetical protein
MNTSSSFRRPLAFAALAASAYLIGLLLGLGIHRPRPLTTRMPGPQASAETTVPGRIPREARRERSAPGVDQSQASVPALLPGPGTSMSALETALRRMRGPMANWSEDDVLPMLFALSPQEFPKAWALIKGLPPEPRGDVVGRLFRAWGQKDPTAALAAISGMSNRRDADGLTQEVLRGWAREEPHAALAWASQMPPGQNRDKALGAAIEGISFSDPSAAAIALTNLPAGDERAEAATTVAFRLAGTDPRAALGLLGDVDSSMRGGVLAGAAMTLASKSVPDALAWAKTLPDPQQWRTALIGIASEAAKLNPSQAVSLVTAQSDPALAGDLAKTVVENWAQEDEPAASAWVSSLPAGELRQRAWSGLESYLQVKDPKALVQFTLNKFPFSNARSSELTRAGADLVCAGGALMHAEACDWVASLPSGLDRDDLVLGLYGSFLPPAEVAPLVASMTPGPAQASTAAGLAQRWAGDAPAAAAEWSASLSMGPARNAALGAVANGWAASDPASAAQWVESLPVDAARENAVLGFIQGASAKHPEQAAPFLGMIADPAKLQQMTSQVLNSWMRADPQAAQVWAQRAGLGVGP